MLVVGREAADLFVDAEGMQQFVSGGLSAGGMGGEQSGVHVYPSSLGSGDLCAQFVGREEGFVATLLPQ